MKEFTLLNVSNDAKLEIGKVMFDMLGGKRLSVKEPTMQMLTNLAEVFLGCINKRKYVPLAENYVNELVQFLPGDPKKLSKGEKLSNEKMEEYEEHTKSLPGSLLEETYGNKYAYANSFLKESIDTQGMSLPECLKKVFNSFVMESDDDIISYAMQMKILSKVLKKHNATETKSKYDAFNSVANKDNSIKKLKHVRNLKEVKEWETFVKKELLNMQAPAQAPTQTKAISLTHS